MKYLTFAVQLILLSSYVLADYTCGNNICESYENRFSCARDCPSGIIDHYCDASQDGVCDPDCSMDDPDCASYSGQVSQASTGTNPVIVFVASAIVVVALILLVRHIMSQKIEDKKLLDPGIIKKTSLLGKQDPEGWEHKSETEIVSEIKNEDKYRQFFQKP